MSKKLSATQVKRLEAKKVKLQKKFDELDAIENPTEEQLTELQSVESELLEVTEQLEASSKEVVGDAVIRGKNRLSTEEMPSNYEVPANEKHLVHAAIRIGSRFDSETGKQISHVFVQKYNVTDFKNLVKNAERLGIWYGILHEPKK